MTMVMRARRWSRILQQQQQKQRIVLSVVGRRALHSNCTPTTTTTRDGLLANPHFAALRPRLPRHFSAASDNSAPEAEGSHEEQQVKPEQVPIIFIDTDGNETEVAANVGDHLLDVAHANHIELEGACGGELACSTCHLIFQDQAIYDALPPKSEEEEDMLDLAFEVTETSRLGCQIPVKKEYAGTKLRIPDDGFN